MSMSIEALMEHACIGDRVVVDLGPGNISTTGVESGVYEYAGCNRGPELGAETRVFFLADGDPIARPITLTWLSRQVYSFDFARAVAS